MPSSVASRYAAALVDVLVDPKNAQEAPAVVEQLEGVRTAMRESNDLRKAFISPAVSIPVKRRLVEQLTPVLGLSPITNRFLTVVINHRRMDALTEIIRAVRNEMDERQGIARPVVTSAAELGGEQRGQLEQQLQALTGREVRAQYQVDPELMGGVSVRIGSKVFDGSIRGQIQSLRRQLAGRTE